MNKEQQQIVDKVYEEYERFCQSQELTDYDDKETFIKSIKNYSMFAERWRLKIDERELSHQERSDLKNSPPYDYGKPANGKLIDVRLLDSNNVPTKLITITYQDKTIESYE
jgi:hypothetical protein